MQRSRFFGAISLLIASCTLSLGCGTNVPANNQFDPAGKGTKAPGRIEASVFIQGLVQQAGHRVSIYDEANAEADTQETLAGGLFNSAELSPGLYRLEVEVPVGNVPIRVDNIEVNPGLTTKLGLLTSVSEPPVGIITGTVGLEQTADSPQGVRVVATRLTGTVTQSWVTFADALGAYFFNALPAGKFEVLAERDGFTPDLVQLNLEGASPARAEKAAAPLTLYPASAVMNFRVLNSDNILLPSAYTKSDGADDVAGTADGSVVLELLGFGGVNEMRFSEDSGFDGGGQTWRSHEAQASVALSAGEGRKTVYAQFRRIDTVSSREILRTQTYQTSIIFDETAPIASAFVVAPQAREVAGVRYVNADLNAVPLEITAYDAHSGMAGYKLIIEGSDPAAFTPRLSTGPSMSIADTVTLSPVDGSKVVELVLIDKAGNVSAPIARTIEVDSTPPVLLTNPAVSVRGAVAGEINSRLLTLQFLVGQDEGAGVDGPVRMRFGRSPAPPQGPSVSFLPEVTLNVDAAHGDILTFYGIFEDNAGNSVLAESVAYTLNLRGRISGTVYLEGTPETALLHGGTIVDVFAADDLMTVVATGTSNADGSFSVSDIPEGAYQVRLGRAGAVSAIRAPIRVQAGQATALGIERLALARGDIVGVFNYADLGPAANHAGITVTASLGGRVEATAVTDESGQALLSGVPETLTLNYEILARADGYVTARVDGVAVGNDEIVDINSGPPQNGNPIALAKLSGDFKICDAGDTGAPSRDCGAILYTNANSILLGLNAEGVTDMRYIVDDPAATDPFPDPTTGCTPAVQGCWAPYDPAQFYLTDLSGQSEGQLTILVQFRDGTVEQPVGKAQVVLDKTPPLTPSLSIRRGANALLDGYTNNAELTIDADALSGGADTAPVSSVRLSRDAVWDGDGTNADKQYSFGGPKVFDVALGDGVKNVSAWFCDAAGNCNTTPVSDSIILDTLRPSRVNGRDVTPLANWIVPRSSREWWSRSTRFDMRIDLGTSSEGIAEVAAYRLSLSEQFVGAAWSGLDVDVVNTRAGGTGFVNASGIELPPVDGEHVVWAQFRDAAGNESSAGEIALDRFSLFLDSVPPGGTVTLEGGALYTALTPVNVALTTDTSGGAVEIQSSWSGVLPDPYADARQGYTTSFSSAPAVGDGQKTLFVRFFDPAGNFSERQASIFLDQTPPDASAVALCNTCSQGASGDIYYNDTNGDVTLFLFASDNSGFIDHVRVSIDGGATQQLTYAPYIGLTISTAPGPHSVDVSFVDAAGNARVIAPLALIYDRVNPTVSVSINGGAMLTNSASVALGINGNDDNELSGMYVSNSSTFSGAPLLPYAPSLDWTLGSPLSSGSKTVYVRVVDAAGNSFDDDAVIQLDVDAPTNPRIDLGTGQWSTVTSVPAVISAVDATEFFIDGDVQDTADTFAWVAYKTSAALSLTTGDGDKTVWIRFRDAAGNESAAVSDLTFLDETPPVLKTVAIVGRKVDGGRDDTTTAQLSVDIELLTSGATLLALSTTGSIDCSVATYDIASAPSIPVTITTAGQVHICARDAAGNIAGPVSDTIIVDQSPPACTLSLRGYRADGSQLSPGINDTQTATTTIDVVSSCSGAPVGMAIVPSGQSIDCATAAYASYATTASVVLSVGDGAKNVNACFRDAVGNVTAAPLSSGVDIALDQTGPSNPTIALSSGTWTITTAISANLSATGAATMFIAGDVQDTAATLAWVSYSASAPLLLTTGDDTKTVGVRFRDALLNESTIATDTTNLDQTPPILKTVRLVGENVDGSANFTTTAVLGITLSIVGSGADGVAISTSILDCNTATYDRPFAVTMPVTITAAGAIYVCVRDLAGNRVGFARDDIVVDQTPPSCTANLRGYRADGTQVSPGLNDSQTALTTIDLLSSCTGAPVGIAVVGSTQSLDCASASYSTYAANIPITVSAGDGTKNVNVCYKDAVGNALLSPISAASDITLDATPPSGSAVFVARAGDTTEAAYTSSTSVSAYLTSVGAAQMRSSSTTTPGSWISYSTSAQSLTLLSYAAMGQNCSAFANGANRRVYAQFRDALRNTSTFVTDEIIFDPCAPAAPSVSILASPYANGDFVEKRSVNVALGGLSGASTMRVAGRNNAGCPGMSGRPEYDVAASIVVNFSSDGFKRVCVALEDAAGNLSTTAQDTITIDTVRPTAPVLSPGNTTDANYACASVTKTADASVDANFWKWQGRQNGGAWTDLGACGSRPCVNGSNRVEFDLLQDTDNDLELRAVDNAGNLGFANSVYVEEVSSFLYPTRLTVKQVCNSGDYMILRDEKIWPIMKTRCFAGDGGHYSNRPEVGLFDLDALSYQRFNGDGGLAAALEPGYVAGAIFRTAWDAACEPDQPQLLFPYFPENTSTLAFGQSSSYAVWKDPFGANAFDYQNSVKASIGPAGDWYVPGSIDVASFDSVGGSTWYEFNALVVNQNSSIACGPGFDIEKLFQVRYQSGTFADDSLYTAAIAGEFTVALDGTLKQNRRWIYGLGFNGSSSTFLHWEPQSSQRWRVRRVTSWGTGGVSGSLAYWYPAYGGSYAWGGYDEYNHPYNRLARPAQFPHQTYQLCFPFCITLRNNERQQHVVVGQGNGDSASYRVSDANLREIGDNLSSYYMPAFEAGIDQTGWIDLNEPNRIRIGDAGLTGTDANSDYTDTGEIYDFRYSIDTRRPLFSAMRDVAGEPRVIYHTGGLGSTEGVVVGFRNNLGCLGD